MLLALLLRLLLLLMLLLLLLLLASTSLTATVARDGGCRRAQCLVAGSFFAFYNGDDVVYRLGGQIRYGEGLSLDVRVHYPIERDEAYDGVSVVVAVAVGGDGAGLAGRYRMGTRRLERAVYNSLADLVDEHAEALAFGLLGVQGFCLSDPERDGQNGDRFDGGEGVGN